MKPGPFSERAAVFAPNGREASIAVDLLREAGLASEIAADLNSIERALYSGAGLAVIAEEGLLGADLTAVASWIANQPAWSDFPFIVLTRRGGSDRNPAALRLSELLGNVSFLERPFDPTSFVSTVRTAVRARRRQYEARARIAELNDRQERLRFAQEAGGIGTFELFADTRMLSVSEQFCRIWGLGDRTSVSLAELMQLVDPQDHDRIMTSAPELTTDALQYTEYRIHRPDTHEVRWLARRGEALPDGTTGNKRFFGIVYDITERKNAELALRERDAFTRLLINSTTEAFYAVDTAGSTTLCNTSFLRLLGFSDESEVLGRKLHTVIHHSHPDGSPYPVSECPIYCAASNGQPAIVDDEYFFRKDGSRIPVEYRTAPIVVNGVLQGAICTFVDITQRKRAADELKRLNATLEQRVEERTRERDRMWRLSSDLMDVRDVAGRFLAVNRAWTVMLGWTEAELLRTVFSSLLHPDDLENTRDKLNELASDQPTFRFENRCRHKDGSYRLISWTTAFEDGQLYGIGRDITRERETEDALRQSQKMEAVGQLTGGIAHDFNNLLQSITAALDMLRLRAAKNPVPDTERLISVAMTSANKAASLVHHLLAFSRRQPLSPTPVDGNVLVASMRDLLTHTLGHAIQLEFVLADDLWLTLCDPNQLESAVLNLSINARDAMPDGGKLIIETCNIHRRENHPAGDSDLNAGEYVCFAITDTGTGMSPEILTKAFEPFFTTKAPGEGTGLGLSMVYGFAKQSEGYAKIRSEMTHGTTISLYLPRYHGAARTEVAELEKSPDLRARLNACVLLVEDERGIREVVAEVLGDLGLEVCVAEDGLAGLAIIESGRALNLLIADIGLPGMNGRTLAARARVVYPDLPILLMTGYAENASLANGFLGPGMNMITKPFPLSALIEKVQAILHPE